MTTQDNAGKLHELLSAPALYIHGLSFEGLLRLTGLGVIALAETLKELIDAGHVELHEARNGPDNVWTVYRIARRTQKE